MSLRSLEEMSSELRRREDLEDQDRERAVREKIERARRDGYLAGLRMALKAARSIRMDGFGSEVVEDEIEIIIAAAEREEDTDDGD